MRLRVSPWLAVLLMGLATASAPAAVRIAAGLRDGQPPALRPVAPGTAALRTLSRVPSSGGSWEATWDPDTGFARMLYGGRSAPSTLRLEAHARGFLVSNASLFGLTDARDLRTRESVDHRLGETLRFQQTYKGLEVYPGDVSVSRSAEGQIYLVGSGYRPQLSVATTARVSAAEARRAAVSYCGSGTAEAPKLVVWALTRPFRLAWRVQVAVKRSKYMRVYLDAVTGKLITKDNLVMHESSTLANVYRANPISTPEMINVSLTNLDGSGTLTGQFAAVYKYTQYDANQAVKGASDLRAGANGFVVPAGDSRMNQTSAYYHVNLMHDYYKSTHGFTKRDQSLPIYVNVPNPDGSPLNNAYFTPQGQYLVFGVRTSGEDYAMDGDTIGHEYTHSVVATLCGIGNNPIWSEARAMNEGLADYFSCTVMGDGTYSEYGSGKKDGGGSRDLTNRRRYPEEVCMREQLRDGSMLQDFPEEHEAGQIWAASLWDLRRSVGAAISDKIVFSSIPLLPDAATFGDGRVTLRTADQQLGTGQAAIIGQILDNRGIQEQGGYSYVDPFGFSVDNGYEIGTGFISPDGGPFEAFGFLPVFVSGRQYGILGLVNDQKRTIKAVRLTFLDQNGTVVDKLSPSADAATVPVKLSNGNKFDVKRFMFVFQVPEGLQGNYQIGFSLSTDGQSFPKPDKTAPAWVLADRGPAPQPGKEVVTPPTPTPSPTPTPDPTPVTPEPAVTPAVVQVAPLSVQVPVGGEQRFAATVTDTTGKVTVSPSMVWTLEGDQSLADISSNGILSARQAGQVTVVAKAGDVAGRAQVTIIAATAPTGITTWAQMPGSEKTTVYGMAGSSDGSVAATYAVGANGTYRSVDDGSFIQIAEGEDQGVLPFSVAVNPLNPRIVWVGTLSTGLFRSEDGGGWWTQMATDLAEPWALFFYGSGFPAVVSIATDEADEVLIGTLDKGTFYRNGPIGQWMDVSAGLSSAMVTSSVLNKAGTWLFVGSSTGAYKLNGSLSAWKSINNGLKRSSMEQEDFGLPPFINQLALSPSNDKDLLAATDGDGVFFSNDDGETWQEASTGLGDKTVYCVAFDPAVPGRVFAGTAKEGVYYSL
ncbi:MAG TPA: M36 family metallopeptidase, partial [Armatimonadota bacterium]